MIVSKDIEHCWLLHFYVTVDFMFVSFHNIYRQLHKQTVTIIKAFSVTSIWFEMLSLRNILIFKYLVCKIKLNFNTIKASIVNSIKSLKKRRVEPAKTDFTSRNSCILKCSKVIFLQKNKYFFIEYFYLLILILVAVI